MFAALPPDAAAVHVGVGTSCAALRVRDWRAARALLEQLLADADRKGWP